MRTGTGVTRETAKERKEKDREALRKERREHYWSKGGREKATVYREKTIEKDEEKK